MARFVIFKRGMSPTGSPVAVNADQVVEVYPGGEYKGQTVSDLYGHGSQKIVTVRGDLQTVVALLNGQSEQPISYVRLHPSILLDDKPAPWAPKPATDGGDS